MGERLSRDKALMGMADIVAERGTCNRLQVGAVIAREFRVISTGYNGPPASMPHCAHTSLDDRVGCTASVHAELNSILAAAKHGVEVNGATLYVTHMPCLTCAQAIINSGISKVFYEYPYRKTEGIELLMAAGVMVDMVKA